MKSTDLRINNKVFYEDRVRTITAISKTEVELDDYLGVSIRDIDSIPITPEILNKCKNAVKVATIYEVYNINGIMISFINGKWIEYVSQIEIKGLHHLQNIVYFRTETELEINL